MRNKAITLILALCSCIGIKAQVADSIDVLAQKTDSIDVLAQDPDFIRVSLITASPGNKVYSAYGHAALRMECPSNSLDYCFTFEMALSTNELLRFLTGEAKAGFCVAPTPVFLQQYESEGRGVTAYQLNLLPEEEQTLWRLLDKELEKDAHWTFDLTENSCASMVTWILKRALAKGSNITYQQLPEAVAEGTYRDVCHYYSSACPWTELFWQIVFGRKGFQKADIDKKMVPVMMGEAWQHAVITDATTGQQRPLVIGKPVILCKQTYYPTAPLVTPGLAGTGLLLAIIAIAILYYKKKKTKKE